MANLSGLDTNPAPRRQQVSVKGQADLTTQRALMRLYKAAALVAQAGRKDKDNEGK